MSKPLIAGDLTLNEVLAKLGLTKRQALGNYNYHILDGSTIVHEGCAYSTFTWLRETRRIA